MISSMVGGDGLKSSFNQACNAIKQKQNAHSGYQPQEEAQVFCLIFFLLSVFRLSHLQK